MRLSRGLRLGAGACLVAGLVWLPLSLWPDRLPEQRPAGGIWLLARPGRATVEFDGRVQGKTPFHFVQPPPASTTVRLSLGGYESSTLTGAELNQAEVRLRPSYSFLLRRQPLLCLALLLHLCYLALLRWGRHDLPSSEQVTEAHWREPELGPGSCLGDFKLIRRLGKGTAAEVFLGEGSDGTLVAVKILFRDVSHNMEFRVRFEREASVCATLEHPRLVKTHAWSVQNNRFWMAQTYLPGGSLQDWLKPSGLQPGLVKKVLAQIAEGLAYAHQRGVFHRDIKPANILLNAKGEPVIADFGIARIPKLQTVSSKNDIIGTPAFVSPEQIEGKAIDGRSDLYSLGIVGYELLTGTVPFSGKKTLEVMVAHLRQPPPPLRELNPAVPEAYEAVVLKLLAKRPEDRFQTAEELIAALDDL